MVADNRIQTIPEDRHTMENGVYIAKHIMLNSTRKLCVQDQRVNVYTQNGNFVCVMKPDEAINHFGPFNWWKKQEKRNMLYNLLWMVGGQSKEVISINATYPVVKWKAKELRERGHYTQGLLLPIPSNLS